MNDTAQNIGLKVLWILIGFAGSFFEPISTYLIVMISLVFTDLFTGIAAAKKRSETIRSKGLRETIKKISYYFLAILLSRIFEIGFFEGKWIQEHVPLTYVVAAFICSIEFQSNIENIGELTGINIWAKVKEKLSQLLNNKP